MMTANPVYLVAQGRKEMSSNPTYSASSGDVADAATGPADYAQPAAAAGPYTKLQDGHAVYASADEGSRGFRDEDSVYAAGIWSKA